MPSNVPRSSSAIFARVERSTSSVCVNVTSTPIIGPPPRLGERSIGRYWPRILVGGLCVKPSRRPCVDGSRIAARKSTCHLRAPLSMQSHGRPVRQSFVSRAPVRVGLTQEALKREDPSRRAPVDPVGRRYGWKEWRMKRTARVILTLSLTAILLGATASTASATRTLSPTSVDYGNRQIGTSSPAQAFTLKVRCTLVILPTTRCIEDTFSPSISTSGQFAQTNNCPGTLTGLATKPGVDPELGAQTCTINVTFTPTSTGPQTGTLRTTGILSGSPGPA